MPEPSPIDDPHPRDRTIGQLVREGLDDLVGADGRVWRTLAALLTSPGTLTLRDLAGDRTHLRPTRLYLLASLLLFGALRLADPGTALGTAMLEQERSWLASGQEESAMRELELDLERLRREATQGAAAATQRAEYLGELLAAVRRGERRNEAAEAVVGRVEEESLGSSLESTTLTEEDLARAQASVAGRLLEWLPLAIVFLLPVHAFGLWRLAGRSRGGIAALVLSLDAHAFVYLIGAVIAVAAVVLGWSVPLALGGSILAPLAFVVWQTLALKKVFEVGWPRATGVAIGWSAGYAMLVLFVCAVTWAMALAAG